MIKFELVYIICVNFFVIKTKCNFIKIHKKSVVVSFKINKFPYKNICNKI